MLLGEEGPRIIYRVFILFILEGFLAAISFPLYVSVGPEKVTAFFDEKGGYSQVAFDYKLRRILTLTGASILLFFGFIKLLFIHVVPSLFGPLELYAISDLRAPEVLEIHEEFLLVESGIQTADFVQSLPEPVITGVKKLDGKDFIFTGLGEPGSSIVLLVTDMQTIMYTGEISEEGEWQLEHSQEDLTFKEGNHAIRAFIYDADSETRSDFSEEQFFKVEETLIDSFVHNVDVVINSLIILTILFGSFLILITI